MTVGGIPVTACRCGMKDGSLVVASDCVRHAPSHAATLAKGTCPSCGYFNHADASVSEREDLVYCVNCQNVWRTECL